MRLSAHLAATYQFYQGGATAPPWTPSPLSGDPWRAASCSGGYAWWYLDGAGAGFAVTVILFAGSVFSPTYAEKVRRGSGERGLDHPAVNVVLFEGQRQIAWVMNEHPAARLSQEERRLTVDGSALEYGADGAVTVHLSERLTHFGPRSGPLLRGTLRLTPLCPPGAALLIGEDQRGAQHHWRPLAGRGTLEAELDLDGRALRFSGHGYHDCNYGTGRLEDAFERWLWAHGDDWVLYHTEDRNGRARALALHLRPDGIEVTEEDPPPRRLRRGRRGLWIAAPDALQVGPLRCQRGEGLLLDAPFYARFPVQLIPEGGQAQAGVGEYLDLSRFRSRLVQHLLRYKTYRAEP